MRRFALAVFVGPAGHRSVPLTRREILQTGLATASALLSGLGSEMNSAAEPTARRRVIVVGAGFAGLACGYELLAAGYDVRVIEARDRVGGRVHSLGQLIPGKHVEGGGELLGSNHPHVLAYAAKFGLEFLDVSEDKVAPSPMILGGRKLLGHEVERIKKEVQAAFQQMTEAARDVVADEPWKTPDAERLDRITMAEWIQQQKLSPLAKSLLTLQFTSDNGVSPEKQSYLGNLTLVKGGGLEKFWTDTEVYRCRGGNQQFALRFAKEIGEPRLTLNCPVREITAGAKEMTVIDAEGRKHPADDVVLAIPPSVWSMIKFTPALPPVLAPQMGMNVKYLAVVQNRFWRGDKLPPDAWGDGDINQTWDGTDGQGEDHELAALVSFSGGPSAEAIHRRAANEQQTALLKELEAFYPGFGKHFVKGQLVDWIAEPWTRGGYSFPAPGEVTTIGPVLRQGIGRLHFAGEHACYQFVGFMEGALHSGASLAKRLAVRDGIVPKS